VTDADPQKLSDALEREAKELERDSSELQDQIDETRQDWKRKRADEGVPGAPPEEGLDAEAKPVEAPEASGKG